MMCQADAHHLVINMHAYIYIYICKGVYVYVIYTDVYTRTIHTYLYIYIYMHMCLSEVVSLADQRAPIEIGVTRPPTRTCPSRLMPLHGPCAF